MNDARDHLEALIASREVRIAVIGLGYVGLPLAHALYAGGARVLGVDNDPAKIESLNAGRNYLKHLGDAMAAELAASDRFDVTTDFERLAEVDVVLVCVPTPLRAGRVPDLSYVERTGVEIGRRLHAGQLVVLESTTYPGTTRREFAGAIEAGASDRRISLRLGQEYWIAFSPEREDPGRKSHTTASIPKLVGGLDTEATRLAAGVYRLGIKEVIEVESAEVAEAAKILENVYRAVNIAMVNEMKTILTDMGINIFDVIRAAATKPFGFEAFWPGPGLGGHCIPIDPYYLSWRAKQIGHEARFIELAGEINHAMPGYVVERTIAALSKRGRLIGDARVLVLGLAYKPDVDDVRESPSFELIEQFRTHGANVDYSDPFIPKTWKMRHYDLKLTSVDLTAQTIASYDAVVISTNHSAFDYAILAQHAGLVVDTRDAMRQYRDEMGDRLVLA